MTDTITLPRSVVEQALEAHRALRDWMHAVPQTVVLPAMPGVDGDWLDDVESTLHTALEQPQVNSPEIPEGWKLVPAEPTDEMREAGKDAHYEAETRTSDADAWSLTGFAHRVARASYIYRAMLAAAPKPPTAEKSSGVEQPQSVTDCHQSQPQVEQEPVAWQFRMRMVDDEEWPDWYSCLKDVAESCWHTPVLNGRQREARALYTHPQNLNCKSTQARLATLWGYVKPRPKRDPLTEEQIDAVYGDTVGYSYIEFARAIEEAIWKKNS